MENGTYVICERKGHPTVISVVISKEIHATCNSMPPEEKSPEKAVRSRVHTNQSIRKNPPQNMHLNENKFVTTPEKVH
jgi:hypothetical protein